MYTVVREFYANSYEYKDGKNTVLGNVVKFGPSTINRFHKLANVENNDYIALQGNADYKVVIRF